MRARLHDACPERSSVQNIHLHTAVQSAIPDNIRSCPAALPQVTFAREFLIEPVCLMVLLKTQRASSPARFVAKVHVRCQLLLPLGAAGLRQGLEMVCFPRLAPAGAYRAGTAIQTRRPRQRWLW